MQWHLANILTAGRLVMVPDFFASFVAGFYPVSFIAFTAASFTDLIDGAIARFLKQHSQLGAFLDPLADKLLMLTAFSCLVYKGVLPGWFLTLVILRDVMIMGGIGALKILKFEVKYEPFRSSKIATLLQIILGILALGFMWSPAFQFGVYPLVDFVEGTMYVTASLIVITALQYIQKGITILQTRYAVSQDRNKTI